MARVAISDAWRLGRRYGRRRRENMVCFCRAAGSRSRGRYGATAPDRASTNALHVSRAPPSLGPQSNRRMRMCHRAWRLSLLLVGALPFAAAAVAQDYPSQTVKMVVPFVAGGGVDVVARIVAPRLGEELGQSV